MEEIPVKALVAGLGFLAGIVFGATAQKTHFCTMGGISDMVMMGDTRRFRSWMLAIAVALLGTQALWGLGYVDLSTAIYRTPNLGWFGAIAGGLMFGYGMVMGGGCGNKTLVRVGGGNLKSFIVFLIIALTAYMTLRGLFALGRVQMEATFNTTLPASQGIDALLARATGLGEGTLRAVLAVVLGGALIAWCFKDEGFRGSPKDVIGGVIVGLMIPLGWFITGYVGRDEFEPTPVMSFTFIAPIGDTTQYLMTFTGASINFGIATVFGVIAGSFLMAKATGAFRLEGFAGVNDTVSNVFGAVLMGIGGVLALGCTIGQGISGISTLALSSFLALGSIIAGAYYGLKYMEEGSHGAALRVVFSRG